MGSTPWSLRRDLEGRGSASASSAESTLLVAVWGSLSRLYFRTDRRPNGRIYVKVTKYYQSMETFFRGNLTVKLSRCSRTFDRVQSHYTSRGDNSFPWGKESSKASPARSWRCWRSEVSAVIIHC